jgi:starch phosphorylase
MNLPLEFSVIPNVPEKLEPLRDLAYNLWWAWHPEARELFADLDPKLWEEVHHNPAAMLRRVEQAKLHRAASDESYVGRLRQVCGDLNDYLERKDRWFNKQFGDQKDMLVAYFSAEFGFHESLQTYSGGLGILAGDHCKSASDVGLPFIGVGLMYRQGYFTQHLNKEGWQEAVYRDNDFNNLPISEVRNKEGHPHRVTVQLPGRTVIIRGWEAKIGRIKVLFLDTDLPENREDDRRITYQLYGGDHDMRIRQEIVLGIGGVRFLRGMGLRPTVYHMNEGHAAFLALERVRSAVVEHSAGFYAGLQAVASTNLFTTHTPVPAGNDAFSTELMATYFGDYVKELTISFDEFLKYGRPWQGSPNEPFSMTILALRLSRFCNGVSAIHGGVSREMWQPVWPGVPAHEIPIGHITNGIHTQTWIAPEIKNLIEPKTGPIWENNVSDLEAWRPIYDVRDEDLWDTHQQLKHKLVEFARQNVRNQRLRNRDSAKSLREVVGLLDPNILTIGFARRFATYKRASLLLRDLDRLSRLCNHAERPIQFVFAGKAHPADDGGKRLIQMIYQAARRDDLKHRLVFMENYDINVARHMYHGVDVWLNNPTRPLEASGTSGEKVCPNGAINCSVLDGWWAEAWQRHVNGWSIGENLNTHDPEVQSDFDAESLYTLLEHEIAPLYYQREKGVPHAWIQIMKNSMATISPEYSTFRQVVDYTQNYYIKAHERGQVVSANNHHAAQTLADWKAHVRRHWNEVRISNVSTSAVPSTPLTVGGGFPIRAHVHLGALSPSDVAVEVYCESTDGYNKLVFPMRHTKSDQWEGTVEAADSGHYRFSVRALPYHELLVQKHELRLITWAS